jgi:hypothetical protein
MSHSESPIFHLTIPAACADLLPAEILDAAATLAGLRAKRGEMQVRTGTAALAIPAAEQADTIALAHTIRAGKADPGPVNANAARTELADAKRQAEAVDLAVFGAAQELAAAVISSDPDAIVVRLEALATEEAEKAREALATAHTARDRYRNLRDLALWVDRCPNGGPSPRNSPHLWASIMANFEKDLAEVALQIPQALAVSEPVAADA